MSELLLLCLFVCVCVCVCVCLGVCLFACLSICVVVLSFVWFCFVLLVVFLVCLFSLLVCLTSRPRPEQLIANKPLKARELNEARASKLVFQLKGDVQPKETWIAC